MEAPGQTEIKIQGGKYSAIDTGDGFFTVRDVPILSEVPKGTKEAPEDIGQEWLQRAVDAAKKEYGEGKYTGPVHIGHNDHLGLTHPDFGGFFLPTHVGRYSFSGEEKWTIFADLKLKAAVFERARRGELPYISPEVPWKEGRIGSVSFLDSKPPFFHYAIFTIGEVTKDSSAQFEAHLKDSARFMEGEKKGQACCAHCDENRQSIARMMKSLGISGGHMTEPTDKKPIEQPPTKMDASSDPKLAAQFAAMEAKIAELEKKDKAREDQRLADERTSKAMKDLEGFAIADSTRAMVAKFAAQGESQVAEFVTELKKNLPKFPPKNPDQFDSRTVSMTDPALAKFQQMGPDVLEKAAKALGQYEVWKQATKTSLTAEQFIAAQLGVTIR